MSTAVLDSLRAERDDARNAAVALAEADDFDPQDSAFVQLRSRAEALDSRIAALTDIMGKQKAAADLDSRMTGVQTRRQAAQTQTTEMTPGEVFVRSEQYRNYPGRGTSERVELELFTRAPLLTTNFNTPPNVVLDVTRRVIERNPRPAGILDLASIIPVSTNSVDIVTYAFTNHAAVVAEGAVKPESGPLTPTVTSMSLNTVAHYIQFSRQLAEDSAAIRSRIDTEMREGVEEKFEADAMTALTSATLGAAVSGGGDMLKAIRKAIGVLGTRGFNSGLGIVLNPEDHADLDLAIVSKSGIPVSQNAFFGVPVISDGRVTAGEAYVGDFKKGIEHYRRTAVTSYLSDSHADTFIHNLLTLLAEGRGLTAITRPSAILHLTRA